MPTNWFFFSVIVYHHFSCWFIFAGIFNYNYRNESISPHTPHWVKFNSPQKATPSHLVAAFISIGWTSHMHFTRGILTDVRSCHHISGVLHVDCQLRCWVIIPAIATEKFSNRGECANNCDHTPRHHITDTTKNRQMALSERHWWYHHSKTHNIFTRLCFALVCCENI